MITVHKRTAHRLLAGVAVGATAAAVTIHAIPAHADQVAVFLGGTGTGMVPAGTTAPAQFITPWITGPYTGLNMIYDGAPWATPQSSVAGLNAWVDSRQARGDRVMVVGLSKGAQVAQASMHVPGAPRGVDYVLIGNPDRDHGLNTVLGLRPKYGEVRANVTDVYAQYDGFAEVPNLLNPLAVANALMGMAFVHPFYGTGGVSDPLTRLDQGVVTVTDNVGVDGRPNGTTTTSVRIPTPFLPLTKPIRDTLRTFRLGTDGLDAFDAAVRPVIDAGYPKVRSPKPAAVVPAVTPNLVPVGGVKPVKSKPSANPVHDTVKTVRGMLTNTAKTWAPKPKHAKTGAVQ